MKLFPQHPSNWFRQALSFIGSFLRLVALAADLGLLRWFSEQFDGFGDSDLG